MGLKIHLGLLWSQGLRGNFHQKYYNSLFSRIAGQGIILLQFLLLSSSYPAGAAAGSYIASVSSSSSSSSSSLPCPLSGAGYYIATVSSSFFLPCPLSGAGYYIATVSSSFFFLLLLLSSICQHVNISETLCSIIIIA